MALLPTVVARRWQANYGSLRSGQLAHADLESVGRLSLVPRL